MTLKLRKKPQIIPRRSIISEAYSMEAVGVQSTSTSLRLSRSVCAGMRHAVMFMLALGVSLGTAGFMGAACAADSSEISGAQVSASSVSHQGQQLSWISVHSRQAREIGCTRSETQHPETLSPMIVPLPRTQGVTESEVNPSAELTHSPVPAPLPETLGLVPIPAPQKVELSRNGEAAGVKQPEDTQQHVHFRSFDSAVRLVSGYGETSNRAVRPLHSVAQYGSMTDTEPLAPPPALQDFSADEDIILPPDTAGAAVPALDSLNSGAVDLGGAQIAPAVKPSVDERTEFPAGGLPLPETNIIPQAPERGMDGPSAVPTPERSPEAGLPKGSVIDDPWNRFNRARPTEKICPTAQDLKPISQITNNIAATPGEFPRHCALVSADTHFPGRQFEPTTFNWTASNLCHNPLYFEQPDAERYGHSAGPILQPALSGLQFITTIPTLPYQIAMHPVNECEYSLGYFRPGSCAPYRFNPIPWSVRGALAEGGIITGLVFLIP